MDLSNVTLAPYLDDAACLDVGYKVWDHLAYSSWAAMGGYKKALKVCEACPAKDKCLSWALSIERPGNRHGVWGGTIPAERQALYNAAHGIESVFCEHCGKYPRASAQSRFCENCRNHALRSGEAVADPSLCRQCDEREVSRPTAKLCSVCQRNNRLRAKRKYQEKKRKEKLAEERRIQLSEMKRAS